MASAQPDPCQNGVHLEPIRRRCTTAVSGEADADLGLHANGKLSPGHQDTCKDHGDRKGSRAAPKTLRCGLLGTVVVSACLGYLTYRYRESGRTLSTQISSVEGCYKSAAVASDATVCSQVGRNILQTWDGSAVDAAIATLFCMGVSNLHSMGIGGGLHATIYDRESKSVSVLDARETAPASSHEDMFVGETEKALLGGLSIGVPGEVAGYWAMHQRYGRLPWSLLMRPAIVMCEEGLNVTAALRRAFQSIVKYDRLSDDVKPFVINNETGDVFWEGDVLRFPELAETLRTLARDGADSFYRGELAKRLVADLREKGAIITEEDLAAYRVKWREPMSLSLDDGHTLYAPGAPAVGGMLCMILNILKGYNFNNESLSTVDNTILAYHRMVEAMKLAYAQRTFMGDPDFIDVVEVERRLTSQEFGERLRNKIDDTRTFDTDHYGYTIHNEVKAGTSHLSVIDKDGNAVSVTSSLNQYCGSTVVGRRTGVIFNNAMDDFSTPNITNHHGIEPFPANFIKPGKRPLSSKTPVIVLKKDNSVKMVTGAAGGSKISTSVAQVIFRCLQIGQSLGVATDEPRFHHQLLPPTLFIEGRIPKEIVTGLQSRGHEIEIMPTRGTVVQSILMDNQEVVAVSDNRKGGEADGY